VRIQTAIVADALLTPFYFKGGSHGKKGRIIEENPVFFL